MVFNNRSGAGLILSKKLRSYKGKEDVVCLGIVRGGVVVADKISSELLIPLSILIVKKISPLSNLELAIGALGPKNTIYFDESLISYLGITKKEREEAVLRARKRFLEQEKKFSSYVIKIEKRYSTVFVVDDGVATGATVICAGLYLRKLNIEKIILVTPVISFDVYKDIGKFFDKIVYIERPMEFSSVGQFYKDFDQVKDSLVIDILKRAKN